jgi:hypothetical protein
VWEQTWDLGVDPKTHGQFQKTTTNTTKKEHPKRCLPPEYNRRGRIRMRDPPSKDDHAPLGSSTPSNNQGVNSFDNAEMRLDTDEASCDAVSDACAPVVVSTDHDSRMRDNESIITTLSAHTSIVDSTDYDSIMTVSALPGAIRVDQEGYGTLLCRGQMIDGTEDEDVSRIDAPQGQGRMARAPEEPLLEDLAASATVAALVPQSEPPTEQRQRQLQELQQQNDVHAIEVDESRLEASVVPVWELVYRQQEQLEHQLPMIEAETVQGTTNKWCGLPEWWSKWLLLLLSTMMMIVGVAVSFIEPSPMASPSVRLRSLSTLEEIRTRGFLRCGIPREQRGFALWNYFSGKYENLMLIWYVVCDEQKRKQKKLQICLACFSHIQRPTFSLLIYCSSFAKHVYACTVSCRGSCHF